MHLFNTMDYGNIPVVMLAGNVLPVDRLSLLLGNTKYYHSANPFEFKDTLLLEGKPNLLRNMYPSVQTKRYAPQDPGTQIGGRGGLQGSRLKSLRLPESLGNEVNWMPLYIDHCGSFARKVHVSICTT